MIKKRNDSQAEEEKLENEKIALLIRHLLGSSRFASLDRLKTTNEYKIENDSK